MAIGKAMKSTKNGIQARSKSAAKRARFSNIDSPFVPHEEATALGDPCPPDHARAMRYRVHEAFLCVVRKNILS
jgi:hypothetical protein